MSLRITRRRFWFLLRIALPIAGLVILFFSGIFPLEDLLTANPQDLSASVAASDVASLTNESRVQNGLPPLAVSPLLAEAAQLKADDMAKYSYYAHTGPDGKTMLDWLNEVGYHYLDAGENLVIDRTTAQQAVDAWMNSPDHRANILRPQFTQIGVGVAEGEYQGIATIFVVQEFGTPYPTAVALPVPAKAPTLKPAPASQPQAAVTHAATALAVPKIPVMIPHVAPLAAPSTAPKTIAASTTFATSSNAAIASSTVLQGSSTVSFVLAPEFYAPVTLTHAQIAEDAAQSAPPKGTSVSLISVWLGKIRLYLSHIF